MKVLFDSNVWRKIAVPEDNTDDVDYGAFCKIHDAIMNGKIEAFISENVFTLENVPRKARKSKVSSMKLKMETKSSTEGNKVTSTFIIGPNPNDAVSLDDNEYLKKPTEAAINMGFHIVRLPRIGSLTNIDIDGLLYDVPDFNAYYDKAVEVGEKIESHGAGMAQLEDLLNNYTGESIIDKIKNAPEADINKIAKAIAEMVDGDAVATSIGLGCDYFCTRDEAKGAGTKSVFSPANQSWLQADYGFKTIKPAGLAALI